MGRGFVTMKLDCSPRNHCASSYYFYSGRINKKKHWRDKWGQTPGQFGSPSRCDIARAFVIQHKAYGIGPARNGRIYVLLTGQAANFDAGSLGQEVGVRHGKASYAGVRSGIFHSGA